MVCKRERASCAACAYGNERRSTFMHALSGADQHRGSNIPHQFSGPSWIARPPAHPRPFCVAFSCAWPWLGVTGRLLAMPLSYLAVGQGTMLLLCQSNCTTMPLRIDAGCHHDATLAESLTRGLSAIDLASSGVCSVCGHLLAQTGLVWLAPASIVALRRRGHGGRLRRRLPAILLECQRRHGRLG